MSRPIEMGLVGSNGLGPSTSRLSGVCSNQLSYEPIVVEIKRVELLTSCLQGRRSSQLSYTPIPKTTIRSSVLPFPPGTLYKTNAPLFFGALSLHQLKMIEENKSSLNPVPVSTRMLVNILRTLTILPKRRWSSRTFRYGYLVTTSPQSFVLP